MRKYVLLIQGRLLRLAQQSNILLVSTQRVGTTLYLCGSRSHLQNAECEPFECLGLVGGDAAVGAHLVVPPR